MEKRRALTAAITAATATILGIVATAWHKYDATGKKESECKRLEEEVFERVAQANIFQKDIDRIKVMEFYSDTARSEAEKQLSRLISKQNAVADDFGRAQSRLGGLCGQDRMRSATNEAFKKP